MNIPKKIYRVKLDISILGEMIVGAIHELPARKHKIPPSNIKVKP